MADDFIMAELKMLGARITDLESALETAIQILKREMVTRDIIAGFHNQVIARLDGVQATTNSSTQNIGEHLGNFQTAVLEALDRQEQRAVERDRLVTQRMQEMNEEIRSLQSWRKRM